MLHTSCCNVAHFLSTQHDFSEKLQKYTHTKVCPIVTHFVSSFPRSSMHGVVARCVTWNAGSQLGMT